MRQPAEHDQSRGGFTAIFDDLIPDVKQISCGFFDFVRAEFDLDAAPAAILQFYHSVDLIARIVLVMIERCAKGFRIDFQIALTQ